MTTFTIWRADDGCVRIEDAEGGAIVLMPEEVPALHAALKPARKRGWSRPDMSRRMRAGFAATRDAAE